MTSPTARDFCLTLGLDGSHPVLMNHHVHDRPLVPGVTWLGLIHEALQTEGLTPTDWALEDIVFAAVLSLQPGEAAEVVVAHQAVSGLVRVTTGTTEHCRCILRAVASLPPAPALPAVPPFGAMIARPLTAVYEGARALDIRHGDWMQGRGTAYLADDTVVADITLSDAARAEPYALHPALMDAATVVPFAAGGFGLDHKVPAIPLAIRRLRLWSTGFTAARVLCRMAADGVQNGDIQHNDLWLLDAEGAPLVLIERLSAKRIRSAASLSGTKAARPAAAAASATAAPSLEVDLAAFIAARTGVAQEAGSDLAFYDMGLQSADLLALSAALEEVLGRSLYPTLLYEQSSPRALAGWLRAQGIDRITAAPSPAHAALQEAPQDMQAWLAGFVKREAGLATLPEVDLPFYDLGLGSTTLLALSTALEGAFGRSFYPTLCYEHGSVAALASWLVAEGMAVPGATPVAAPMAAGEPVELAQGRLHWQPAPAAAAVPTKGWARVGEAVPDLRLWQGEAVPGLVWSLPEEIAADALLGDALTVAQRMIATGQPMRLLVLAPCESDAAALVPFLRSLSREMPRLSGRVVSGPCARPLSELPDGVPGFDWISHRAAPLGRCRQALRLTPVDAPQPLAVPRDVVVITGGHGAIALHLLEDLQMRGQRRFALIARRSAPPELAARLAELTAAGCEIQSIEADVADPVQLEAAWRKVKARFGAVGSILHCAGTLRDGLIQGKQLADAQAVLAVKLGALATLDRLSAAEPLAWFVACGSITGVIGNLGQADYAFANGAMAGLLTRRARLVAKGERSGGSLCLNWPFWAEGGMVIDAARAARLTAETGLAPLATNAATEAFAIALQSGETLALPLALGAGGAARFGALAAGLGLAEGAAEATAAAARPEDGAIAIIGMAGEYPGARNLAEFWQNLRDGHDLITPIPADRWDHDAIFTEDRNARGGVYTREGGFIDGHDRFDAAFFNIPPREARLLDPQERRFLQVAWQAVESAGLNPAAIGGSRAGVFVGAMWGDYQLLGQDADGSVAASIFSAIANRVSYALNLTGPSLAVDSMCSSSLTALHLAVESLRRGECDMALAGGVNIMAHPQKFRFLCQNRMLSEDARCRSFGEGGTGYVPGEGIGAALLKPLAQALADGDPVLAVIRGTAISHGGKSAGMTVPSPAAQARTIAAAHEQAGSRNSVGYIEAHGTGTSLGDPIELEGLRLAFDCAAVRGCAIGSVKSNIGHLEGAAGIAALTKVVLQLRHRHLVPSLHAQQPNPKLRLEGSGFHIQTSGADWVDTPRVAGISAFGAGGSNAHVVVTEAPERVQVAVRGPGVLVISARDADGLRRYAADWCAFLQGPDAAQPWAAITATAASGRAVFGQRLAVVAPDAATAAALLAGWLAKGEAGALLAAAGADATDHALAADFVAGGALTLAVPAQRVVIPTYPFEGERFWITPQPVTVPTDPVLQTTRAEGDALLAEMGWPVEEPLFAQHRIGGEPLMPAALMLETARRMLAGQGAVALATARIGAPFAGRPGAMLRGQAFTHGAGRAVELCHAGSGAIVLQAIAGAADLDAADAVTPGRPPALVVSGALARLYSQFAGQGLAYGPLFQTLGAPVADASGLWLPLCLPQTADWRRAVIAMDAAMQAVALAGADIATDDATWLPAGFEGVIWSGDPSIAVWAHVAVLEADPQARHFRISLTDADGGLVWQAARFTLRPRPGAARPSVPAAIPDRTDALRDHLAALLAAESGLAVDRVRRDDRFADLGVDSVMVMNVTARLEEALGPLPKSLFFEHAGITDLAAWLAAEHGPRLSALLGDAAAPRLRQPDHPRAAPLHTLRRVPAAPATGNAEPLAVIGMAGRFPDAEDVAALWENLARSHNAVTPIPESRWPDTLFRNADGRRGNICGHGAFLSDVAGFDADFFGMTPIDAKRADPAERILLETAWSAAEDAGYSRKTLKGRAVGVFVASMWQQYQHFGLEAALQGDQMTGVSLLSSTASRVSAMLGVTGPSLALDTMCSGSLTALHLARQAIAAGDCEAAIIGGVNLSLHPHKYLTLSAGGFLSRAGHCAAFGAGADGYVPGEGASCLMIKPLSKALADGDPIHGLILGTAINHSGGSNGSTVPSASAQTKVIARAIADAGLSPDAISYVECHGTGTALGDPIELEGLQAALAPDGHHPGCHIGSIKSNMGHAEAAAGVIGVIKVLLQFRHEKLAPGLHIEQVNPALDLDRKPFHLVHELTDWRPGQTKYAAVSAFGAGGSNANAVLQSPPALVRPVAEPGQWLFALSAMAEPTLQAQVVRLAAWLADNPQACPAAVSATLLMGREDHACRAAFVSASLADLLTQLRGWLSGQTRSATAFTGIRRAGADMADLFDDSEGREMLRYLVADRRLVKLAQLWASGVEVDFTPLFAPGQPRLSLPGSVFNRVALMFDHGLEAYAVRFENTSDLVRQCYHVEMPAGHPALADHLIDGKLQVSLALMTRLVHEALAKADPDEGWSVNLSVQRPWFVTGRLACDIAIVPGRSGLDLVLEADGAVIATGTARAAGPLPAALAVVDGELRDAAAFYAQFATDGYGYGPVYRAVTGYALGKGTVSASLSATSGDAFGQGRLTVGALDAALQLTRPLLAGAGLAWLPVRVALAFGPGGADGCDAVARVVLRADRISATESAFTLQWQDAAGQVLAHGSARLAARVAQVELDRSLVVSRTWLPAAMALASVPRVFATVTTDSLAAALSAPGVTPALVLRGDLPDLMALWQALRTARAAGQGAFDLAITAPELTPHLAGLTAWFRAVGEEIPGFRGRLLIGPDQPEDAVLAAAFDQPSVLLRQGTDGWQKPGIAELVTDAESADLTGHVVLITGGAGGLGRVMARHLVRRWKAHPVLVGRKPADAGIRALLAELRDQGAQAVYLAADIADPAHADRLARQIRLRFGRLDGVIHAAGITHDAWLVDQQADRVKAVLAPKVAGTDALIDLIVPFAPQWVASFGSISGFLGNPGQSDYSYANAYMDAALTAGLSGSTRVAAISWPLWKDTGMQVDPKMLAVMDRRFGMQPLPVATGLALFDRLVTQAPGVQLVTFGAPERLADWLSTREDGLALRTVAPMAAPAPQPAPVGAPMAAARPSGPGPVDRARAWVAEAVQAETQTPADRLDWHRPIDQFGISSVMSTSIVAFLEGKCGSTLPATMMFECQTFAEVADWLVTNGKVQTAPADGAAVAVAPQAAASPEKAVARAPSRRGNRFAAPRPDIAIVGAACRMPGADSMAAFWSLLAEGRDAVAPIPVDRWDWTAHAAPDQARAMQGGFLSDIKSFDYPFFGIFHKEARAMDPQERLVLETAWHALEDAGIAPSALSDRPVGVYMGAMWAQYQMLARDLWEVAPEAAAANGSMAAISNRLSFLLNLAGPSLTLDTMCSSSLMALKLASDALRAGEIETAIVGGVNLSVHPFKYHQLQHAQFLSPEGRCGAFAAGGDGYVPSEGVGVVILRRADEARADGQRLRALVRGIGVSHGGRANGFTVPRPQKQAAAILAALADADLPPDGISYVEAHGTGTALGDPIEMTGLKTSYLRDGDFPLAMGSVKANIGHAESAAGMASLCKVLLQMQHGHLAPSIHSDPPNPDLGISGTGLVVQKALADWKPACGIRRAGISGFGAGGTNVHVILEDVPADPVRLPARSVELVLLSARDGAALKALALALAAQARAPDADLAAIAASSQLWREGLKLRLAVLATDPADLAARLDCWLAEGPGAGLWQGEAQAGATAPEGATPDTAEDAALLAAAWVQGAAVDWASFWPAGATRADLPLYPFRRLPVWLGDDLPQGLQGLRSERVVAPVVAPPAPVSAPVPLVVFDPVALLVDVLASIFRLDPEDIPLDATFDRIGMDSVAAADCAKQVSARIGTEIDPTWFYNHPTIRQLAAALPQPVAAQAQQPTALQPAAAPVPAKPLSWGEEPIAVIGLSGAFAGAPDLDRFWQNLAAGADSVTEVSPERWDIDAHHADRPGQPGTTISRRMGQLAGIDMFDPVAFGLMPDEVEVMDPQQRLFLKHAVMALDDAALAPEQLDGAVCGVFAGTMTGTYRALLDADGRGSTALGMLGNHAAALPARVAFWLNLTGPTLAVDTACSSSLVSVHLACQAIRNGECSMAVAGGVFVSPGPYEMISSSQAGMLSPDGACKAFDDSANGIALGEGVGVVVLKRLSQAMADGDPVHAVIRASGINQDGRTNGLTAPNALSQARLMSEVLSRAGLAPDDIDYVECHGTGTRLGDPVEVEGLRRAYGDRRSRPLPIGSVKPNIGHCYAAAGIASLIKTILAMRHGALPPSIHCAVPNSLINFAAAGVEVTTALQRWPETDHPRRAAVSAFGYSGTNAHVIVEQAQPRPLQDDTAVLVVLPLSARKPGLVVAQARALAAALRAGPVPLAELAATLQSGRRQEACRAAIIADTVDQAITALEALTEADVRRTRPAPAGDAPQDPAGMAAAFMAGQPVDWAAARTQGQRRAALPGKAFDERRFWATPPLAAKAPVLEPGFAPLPPLPQGAPAASPTASPLRRLTPEDFMGAA